MNYFNEYIAQLNKLNDLLAENNLVGKFNTDSYPMSLTVAQDQSLEAQTALYEMCENGVSSRDAKLILTFPVAEIGVRVYGRFVISDALMNKIKTHGKKLRDLFLQCDFSARMSNIEREEEPDELPGEPNTAEFDEFFEDDIED